VAAKVISDKVQRSVAEAGAAWRLWTTLETNLRVDWLGGRGVDAEVFGLHFEIPYDLDDGPGVVLPYDRVASAQSLAMSTGLRAVALLDAADGLWYASLLRERAAASIEVPIVRERWPAAAHGGAPLAYRMPRSTLHRVAALPSR